MSPSLEDLQKQLAELQAKRVQPALTPANPSFSLNDIEKLVEQKVKSLLEETLKPTKSGFLQLVGTHLGQEDQLWLSKPEVLEKVGDFISSPTGGDYVQLFVTEFKTYYESKTCGNSK